MPASPSAASVHAHVTPTYSMLFKPSQLFAAVLLHVLLLGVLLGGVQCTAKPPPPEVISAVLLNPEQLGQPPPAKAEPVKAEPPQPEPG